VTPDEYILEQCGLFEDSLKTAGVIQEFTYREKAVSELDDLRQLIYPNGTEDLENAVAIHWGAAFTRIIAESYTSRWQVDPETNLPVVVLKCGGRGMQIKSIVYAAKAFKTGESFKLVWNDLIKTLTEAGAEKTS
jgi:hypothetical protein